MWYEFHFRLKSQDGAFQLFRAASGGSGIRDLVPIVCPKTGYQISKLKEEVKSSTIYIGPLNDDINDSPITINDISSDVTNFSMAKCRSCSENIPLAFFASHKENCIFEKEEKETQKEIDKDIGECKL